MARPGKRAIYGAENKKSRPLLNIVPHSGDGGCAPNPRKDNPAAERIAVANLKVPWIIIGDRILGKICLKIMTKSFAPSERTASMYSSFLPLEWIHVQFEQIMELKMPLLQWLH